MTRLLLWKKLTLGLLATVRSYSEAYVLGRGPPGACWFIPSSWFIKFTLPQIAELGFPPLADCWGPEGPHHRCRLPSTPVSTSLVLAILVRWIIATLKMMSEGAKSSHDIQRSFPQYKQQQKQIQSCAFSRLGAHWVNSSTGSRIVVLLELTHSWAVCLTGCETGKRGKNGTGPEAK